MQWGVYSYLESHILIIIVPTDITNKRVEKKTLKMYVNCSSLITPEIEGQGKINVEGHLVFHAYRKFTYCAH